MKIKDFLTVLQDARGLALERFETGFLYCSEEQQIEILKLIGLEE